MEHRIVDYRNAKFQG